MYRSASTSLGSSLPGSSRGSRGELAANDKEAKRNSRSRKTRSDNFSDAGSSRSRRSFLGAKASRELVLDSGSAKSDQPSPTAQDAIRKSLTSPLDDLIAGLGGRPLSHGSVDTHRTSSFSQADDPFEHSTSPRPPPPASPLSANATLSPVPFPLVAPIPSVEVSPTVGEDEDDPEPLLSVDEMEREIARMEAELALSGTPLRASPFSDAPLSVESSPILDRHASLAFPDPPSRVSLARSLSQTSAASSSDVTPRTARRWSIVEVELAYHRMKQMLGSTKASDAGTLAGDSEMGDQSIDVDGAFERALRGLSKGSADEVQRSAPDDEEAEALDESVTMLCVYFIHSSSWSVSLTHALSRRPASLRRSGRPALPLALGDDDPDSTPKVGQHESDELPSSRSPTSSESAAGSALFSHASHKTSRESLHLPTRLSKESLAKASRRHTLAAPVSREALDDVFHAENARSVNEQRVGREELEARAARNYRRRSQGPRTSESLQSLRPVDQRSDDGSLASPGRRSPSRLVTVSLRSGAGRDWSRQYLSPSSPGRAPSPAESFPNTPTQALDDAPLTPTKRLLLNRRWTQDSVLLDGPSDEDARAAKSGTNDTWFPATPERAGHRQSKAPKLSVTDPKGGADHALSMSQIRGMDKLEIFFKCVFELTS